MSGGSYDYLCYKDAEQLFTSTHLLSAMADRLAGMGYATDAASETEDLLLLIRQAQNRITARSERLKKIWRAVEWWDSADSSEEGVRLALAEYRQEIEGKPKRDTH